MLKIGHRTKEIVSCLIRRKISGQ